MAIQALAVVNSNPDYLVSMSMSYLVEGLSNNLKKFEDLENSSTPFYMYQKIAGRQYELYNAILWQQTHLNHLYENSHYVLTDEFKNEYKSLNEKVEQLKHNYEGL